jgi:hypothetical protein
MIRFSTDLGLSDIQWMGISLNLFAGDGLN